MAIFKWTVTFESATSIPADAMVNTFHFEGSGSDPENVADMLVDFYDNVPTGETDPISNWMTTGALTGNYTIRAYDLSDPEPRVPQYTDTGTLTELSAANALPTEVALVFSYHAAPVSGQPPARRRGRIYIGGLGIAALTSGRPTITLIDTMIASGRDLIQASNASTSWDWVQYSPTSAAANLVSGGWVDNAWDTQRRRGVEATNRYLFTGGTP